MRECIKQDVLILCTHARTRRHTSHTYRHARAHTRRTHHEYSPTVDKKKRNLPETNVRKLSVYIPVAENLGQRVYLAFIRERKISGSLGSKEGESGVWRRVEPCFTMAPDDPPCLLATAVLHTRRRSTCSHPASRHQQPKHLVYPGCEWRERNIFYMHWYRCYLWAWDKCLGDKCLLRTEKGRRRIFMTVITLSSSEYFTNLTVCFQSFIYQQSD